MENHPYRNPLGGPRQPLGRSHGTRQEDVEVLRLTWASALNVGKSDHLRGEIPNAISTS